MPNSIPTASQSQAVALFLLLSAAVLQPSGAAQANEGLRVVDGDTIVLFGERIRLDGIDAPELGQRCLDKTGKITRCGALAKRQLERLAQQGPVHCEGTETDGYQRRIATCFAGGVNVNAEMVRSGHAFAFVKYSHQYVMDEKVARKARVGMWSGWAEAPWDYRKAKWQVADQSAPTGCPIKGNISNRGRIYHPPWSPSYSRTRINEAKGERWFCSETEALAAGWRPAAGS